MKKETQDRVFDAIDKQELSPEIATRAKLLFQALSERTKEVTPIPSSNIDYFKLTVALCTAAMCVGRNPTVISPSEVRSNALAIAKSVFTPEGELAPNNTYKK